MQYTEELIEAATQLYLRGYNFKQIHEKCGVSAKINIRIKNNLNGRVPRNVGRYSPEQIDEGIRLYTEENLNLSDIREVLGVSTGINKYIKRQQPKELARERQYERNCEYNVFEKVDTEEKAYWLGFIYADGSIDITGQRHSVVLELQERDKSHLVKFQEFLQTKNKNIYTSKRDGCCTVSVGNVKLVQDLIKLGATPNKTFSLSFPYFIDVGLQHHFMRGFFDGDGSVYIKKNKGTPQLTFGVVGASEDFIRDYENILINNTGINRTKPEIKKSITNGTNILTFKHHGNIQCKKIYDFLYKDATVYLERKKDIFEKLI